MSLINILSKHPEMIVVLICDLSFITWVGVRFGYVAVLVVATYGLFSALRGQRIYRLGEDTR